jgi:hypothetical protein
LTGVKNQVRCTIMDVLITMAPQFAKKIVRKRACHTDIVNLDFLLGHVNVAIHANTRAPQILEKHYMVVLACLCVCQSFPLE